MQIELGKTYIQTDPAAWPESMRGAQITVSQVDDNGPVHTLAVAYSFIDATGRTGEGTMQQTYAEQFLRPVE